jgi:hypothetical protein
VRLIRRRIAATALAIFVLAFALISATGSMGATHKATSTHRSTSTQHRSTASAAPSAGNQSNQDQSGYAPVTTQQS